MRRVDENTYIDSSLVSCAEYQLFVDEMREQGKCYQPDHWTSYQFSAGHAAEPVLGIRRSDAVAFCDWLTKRDDGEWMYRIPSPDEKNVFTLGYLEQKPLGYWTEGQSNFYWISSTPKDAREIDFMGSFINRLSDKPRSSHQFNMELFLRRILDRDIALNMEYTVVRNSPADNQFPADIVSILFKNRDIALKRVLQRAGSFIDLHTLDDEISLVAIRPLNLDLANALQTLDEPNAYLLFFDLFTLQERIAGRSPAFEGIRLVKERMR